MSRQFIK